MTKSLLCGAVLCAVVVARSAGGEELIEEDIKALAEAPDNRDGVPEALKIYPAATEYEIKVKLWQPGNDPTHPDAVVAREKLVKGKYLVSTFQPPGLTSDLIMVVFHDEEDDCYKKYVLLPDHTMGKSIGTRVGDSRSISWVSESGKGDGRTVVLTQEVYSDKDTRWREIHVRDGKVVGIQEGTAVVTKRGA
jgi:hypothetical protein